MYNRAGRRYVDYLNAGVDDFQLSVPNGLIKKKKKLQYN